MNELKKQQQLTALNAFSVLMAIAVNYYSQVYKINGNTVADISEKYFNLFTPADYAFSIWGLIYFCLILFCTNQIRQTFYVKKPSEFILKSEYWFALANIANAIWIIAWLNDYILLSVGIMIVILVSLLKIIVNTNMERWDAPKKIIAFSWWPICLYSGWISVATIANISAYLVKIDWSGFGLSTVTWAILMIVMATVINLAVIYLRNMREFATVGVWALVAIFVRHQAEYENIGYTALAGSAIIFVYILYQGFKNRKTNPFFKEYT